MGRGVKDEEKAESEEREREEEETEREGEREEEREESRSSLLRRPLLARASLIKGDQAGPEL